jgi:hypothetical protein
MNQWPVLFNFLQQYLILYNNKLECLAIGTSVARQGWSSPEWSLLQDSSLSVEVWVKRKGDKHSSLLQHGIHY